MGRRRKRAVLCERREGNAEPLEAIENSKRPNFCCTEMLCCRTITCYWALFQFHVCCGLYVLAEFRVCGLNELIESILNKGRHPVLRFRFWCLAHLECIYVVTRHHTMTLQEENVCEMHHEEPHEIVVEIIQILLATLKIGLRVIQHSVVVGVVVRVIVASLSDSLIRRTINQECVQTA